MSSLQLHQRAAAPGCYEFLLALERLSSRTWLPEDELLDLLERAGTDDARTALGDLLSANLVGRIGDGIGITSLGIRTALLLDAVNGADLRGIMTRLGRYDANLRMYELIREGMTKAFIDTLRTRQGFRRLYLCSPWISFDDRDRSTLIDAVRRITQRDGLAPELFVLTRPVEGAANVPPNSVAPLQELGATIFLNRRLHTKLYVREPDASGGYSLAIVGSQNLTRSRYLELGIRINSDTQMINQLTRYFWDITNTSIEV